MCTYKHVQTKGSFGISLFVCFVYFVFKARDLNKLLSKMLEIMVDVSITDDFIP